MGAAPPSTTGLELGYFRNSRVSRELFILGPAQEKLHIFRARHGRGRGAASPGGSRLSGRLVPSLGVISGTRRTVQQEDKAARLPPRRQDWRPHASAKM